MTDTPTPARKYRGAPYAAGLMMTAAVCAFAAPAGAETAEEAADARAVRVLDTVMVISNTNRAM